MNLDVFRRRLTQAMAVCLACGLMAAVWLASDRQPTILHAASSEGTASMLLAHNVFFTLKDPTPDNVQKLVHSCNRHLTDHPGVAYYACGTLVDDLARPVNDRDWHVGLHIVFENRAAHDQYQDAPRHLQFIAENKESWERVRVFDSNVTTGK